MRSEAELWKAVRPLFKGLDPVRVENLVGVGTPDVNYVGGWMELKNLREWPKRGGVVRVDHFTPQQRVWLIKRSLANGKTFLLLSVEREWLLFTGPVAAEILGKVDRETLYARCVVQWRHKPDPQEFQLWL